MDRSLVEGSLKDDQVNHSIIDNDVNSNLEDTGLEWNSPVFFIVLHLVSVYYSTKSKRDTKKTGSIIPSIWYHIQVKEP